MALLAVAGIGAARTGWAQTPADSTSVLAPFPPDTARVAEPAGQELDIEKPPPRREVPRFDRPRWVMFRSLLLPGWGQVHNRAWVKAALVAAGDGTLRWRVIRDERRLGSLDREANVRLGTLSAADQVLDAARAEKAAAEAEMPPNQARIDAARAAEQAALIAYNGASESYNSAVAAYNVLFDGATARRWIAAGVIAYALLDAYIDAHFKNFDVDFRVDPALPGGGTTPGMRLRVGWRF